MSRRRRNRRRDRFGEKADVNPLNYTGNLSDAMLILAVGIMLALVVHWNVDVSTSGGDMSDSGKSLSQNANEGSGGEESVNKDKASSFSSDDMQQLDNPEDLDGGSGMDKLGEVYYDADSGKYYVIEN